VELRLIAGGGGKPHAVTPPARRVAWVALRASLAPAEEARRVLRQSLAKRGARTRRLGSKIVLLSHLGGGSGGIARSGGRG
jgi:hypothetical protein